MAHLIEPFFPTAKKKVKSIELKLMEVTLTGKGNV
jgi:hypothetical protein